MNHGQTSTDVILIGAGIMSATLGTLLKELAPDWNITVFEQLGRAGEESSNEWNNAGTGHAALCELNYTTERPDGTVDISKAVKVNEQFQVSRQFWAYLVQHQRIRNPQDFIMPLPHMSYVRGEQNVEFLKRRYEALSAHPLFQGMEFSKDPGKLREWVPLMMKERKGEEPIAATKIDSGTDVNFGTLTRMLLNHLKEQDVDIRYKHSVKKLKRTPDGLWELKVKDLSSGVTQRHTAKFVFIGAGGGSLHLLQNPASRKESGSAVFRSADCLWCATIRKSSDSTMPRSTAKLRSGLRRCPFRIWTPGSSTTRRHSCSGRLPASRRSSSRPARCSISSPPSSRITFSRCWRPG
ncbi:hypothetical protein HMSSN139_21020 [Paenibacillus sp. HMSSN-139]|nr:hypothetical protein HMSSN139_21020 [Paenibacillus sp. HMSSN-139]